MSFARPVFANRTSMITRRCSERRCFLRPDRGGEVIRNFLFNLGHAAATNGYDLHAACAMPNHPHIVGTDTLGRRPAFCQQLFGNLARSMNALLRRSEGFWASGRSYSDVELADAAAVLKDIVYTIVNCVRAGLVDRIEDYPGFVLMPEQIGVPITVRRPGFFFRQPGDDAREAASGGPKTARDRARNHAGASRCLPEEVTLVFTKPPQFAHLTLDEYRALVREAVDAATAAILAERRAARRGRCVGRAALFAQSPFARPGRKGPGPGPGRGPDRPSGGLDPRHAGKGGGALARGRDAFWKAHRAALEAFRGGKRDASFPRGTWRAVEVYGTDVELFDP